MTRWFYGLLECCVFLSAISGSVSAQNSADSQRIFGATGNHEVLRHRDFTGSPCLTLGGYARPHIINPNLYDDVVTVRNNCPQRIDLQVCYYQTQECIPVEVPGGETKQAILGSMPSIKDFRFDYREKF